MRPRYVINKGVRKDITAVGRIFTAGSRYVASIYNPKDTTIKIESYANCYEVDGKNVISFSFDPSETSKLKVGFATIEIYDSNLKRMAFRENFAIIRKNSLPISADTPPVPLTVFAVDVPMGEKTGQQPAPLAIATTDNLYWELETLGDVLVELQVYFDDAYEETKLFSKTIKLSTHDKYYFTDSIVDVISSEHAAELVGFTATSFKYKLKLADETMSARTVEISVYVNNQQSV